MPRPAGKARRVPIRDLADVPRKDAEAVMVVGAVAARYGACSASTGRPAAFQAFKPPSRWATLA